MVSESFQQDFCKIMKKMVSDHKRSWDNRLPKALGAYRITVRGATNPPLYSLIYECEAVLLLEIPILSLRVAAANKLIEEKNAELRLRELDSMDEKQLAAHQTIELYLAQMASEFDKKVWHGLSKNEIWSS